jgi:hypothetical protein
VDCRFWSRAGLFLLACLVVSGCGTTSAENASLAEQKLKGAQARLKFQRTESLLSSGVGARIKLGERQIASLGVGGSTLIDVPAGAHKITVDGWSYPGAYVITLNAKAGTMYTLEISPRTEPVVAGIALGMIGTMLESAVNQNGGPFQVRVADAKPAR